MHQQTGYDLSNKKIQNLGKHIIFQSTAQFTQDVYIEHYKKNKRKINERFFKGI